MNSVEVTDEYWFKTSPLVGEKKIKYPSSFKLHPCLTKFRCLRQPLRGTAEAAAPTLRFMGGVL